MKKILLLLTAALLCVGNAGAETFNVDFTSSSSAPSLSHSNTTDGVSFVFPNSNLTAETTGVFTKKGQLKLAKAKTTSLTWSNIPNGYLMTITGFSVKAAAGGNHTWFAYTNNSGKKDEDGWKQKGTSDQTVTLPNIAFSSATTSIIIEAPASSDLYIKGFSVTYNLVSAAAPNITIKGHANITNAWHTNLNFSDYITLENNPANVTVSASSDDEIATYDSNNEVFVIGHKTGTASFTISADDVEDKTFTITTNQYFYEYAANSIGTNATTVLDTTHNQTEAVAALANFRSSVVTNGFTNGQNITCLLENPDFQCGFDWDYGWTGTNDENHTGNGGAGGNETGDPMNGYQRFEDNSNVYARMYRGNWGIYNFSIAKGNVYQAVTLPAGYYRLAAKVKCNSNNDNVDLTDTLYVKENNQKIGLCETKCAKNSGFKDAVAGFAIDGNKTLTVGNSHNNVGGSAMKEVAVDNFALTYVCDYATYDAYMTQYDRAERLKDKVASLTDVQKDINTLADADAIATQTTTLSNACAAAETAIAWVENNAVVVNKSNTLVYAGENIELSRGADYGTRAIVTANGLKVNIATDNETKITTITFVDTDKKLFETNDHYIYTNYDATGSTDFYIVGDDANGYKFIPAGEQDKALGITAEVIMPVDIASATVWHFADTKVNLQVSGTAKWGTFVAPFNVTVPSGVKAYTVAHEGSNAWLTRTELTTGEIPAGTPVLLEQEGSETISQTYYGNATAAVDNSGVLKGVYELTDVAAGDNNYLLQYQNETCAFYLVDAAKQLGAYRCYLHLESALAPARLDLSQPNEVATALPIVDASANATKILVNGKIVIVRNNKAFDLNGMLVK